MMTIVLQELLRGLFLGSILTKFDTADRLRDLSGSTERDLVLISPGNSHIFGGPRYFSAFKTPEVVGTTLI